MKELTLQAVKENIAAVTDFVDELLDELDCPIKARVQIDMAIDEIICNIASYAYTPGTGDVTVRFVFDPASRQVSIVFVDSGVPFDPLSREDPDVTLGIKERQIGGLGIFLVKKAMDAMEYQYKDGQNILTVKKNI